MLVTRRRALKSLGGMAVVVAVGALSPIVALAADLVEIVTAGFNCNEMTGTWFEVYVCVEVATGDIIGESFDRNTGVPCTEPQPEPSNPEETH